MRVLAARQLTREHGAGELALPALFEAFTAKSAFLRAAAVQSSEPDLMSTSKTGDGEFRPVSLVEPMTKALGDDDSEVRKHATSVLGAPGKDAASALPALRKIAEDDRSKEVRAYAERAIGAIG